MIIKAQIIPLSTRGSVTIVGSYKDKDTDKEYFLNSSGKKVMTSIEESDRIFQHTFQDGYPLTITIDSYDFSQKAVIDFWKKHPLVQTDGFLNRNFISEQFKFVIKEEQVLNDYNALLSKLEIVSIVSSMSMVERFNLCFALGGDPRNMSEKEVYINLIGMTLGGIAIARKEDVKNFITVRQVEREASIYANKAVSYGIVKKEGSVYKIGGRNAGMNIDSVVSLILSDGDLFENYIKPEVDKYDSMEVSSIETVDELNIPQELADLLPVNTSSEKKEAKKIGRKKED